MSANQEASRRKPKASSFGTVERLTSGKYRARYLAPTGVRPSKTFRLKADAQAWLRSEANRISRGGWTDPALAKVTLKAYSKRWLDEKPSLAPRTRDGYEWLLKDYIEESLGSTPLKDISPAVVRNWLQDQQKQHPGKTTPQKAYRVLHAIFATAVADEVLLRNPCQVRGGGQEQTKPRPHMEVAHALAIADKMLPQRRALVLVAASTGLRFGELAGLQRRDVNLLKGTITVRRTLVERGTEPPSFGPPKSAAGHRTVQVPATVLPALRSYFDDYVTDPSPDALVFLGQQGGPLTRRKLHPEWAKARKAAGLDEFHFHDLRHLAATLAATSGATLKELMAQIGHSSTRAAMIYQHAAESRAQAVAEKVGEHFATVTELRTATSAV